MIVYLNVKNNDATFFVCSDLKREMIINIRLQGETLSIKLNKLKLPFI